MESTSNTDDTHLAATVREAWSALCTSREFRDFDGALRSIETATLLFGGYPRLIARGGDPLHGRDIDIVIDGDRSSIEAAVRPWIARRTRFGGLHLAVGTQRVDIWSLRDTWAFRAGKVDFPRSPENLVKTVFLSIDALAVDLRSGAVYADIYRDAVKRGELDIVLRHNPYPALCVLRSLVFANEYGMRTSRRLRRYIQHYIRQNSALEELLHIQLAHYGFERLSSDALKSWLLPFRGKKAQLWLFDAPAPLRARVSRRKNAADDPYVSCLLEEQDPDQGELFSGSGSAAAL